MLTRVISIIIGVILVVSGLVVLPLPIPFGLAMIIVGLSLLISNSHYFRTLFKKLRRRFMGLSVRLNNLKPHLPGFARRMIEDTDPDTL